MLNYLKDRLRPKEAAIALFRRENGLFLHPEHKTDKGAWIAAEPCVDMPLQVSMTELGALIRENLAQSRTDMRYPDNHKGLLAFVLKKAGVRSYKQFMSGCRHCSIHQKGSKLVFTHSVNTGSKGFAYTGEPDIETDIDVSEEELGMAAMACLSKSR